MNILIISFDADPPYMGGVSTVINTLAQGLIAKGHSLTLGYYTPTEHPSVFFSKKIQIATTNSNQLQEFSENNTIHIIYNALPINTDWILLKKYFPSSKIISAYHSRPQLNFFPLYSLMNIFYNSPNFFYKVYTLFKIPFLPIQKFRSQKKQKRKFLEMVQYSDRILLLSSKFYPCLKKIVPSVDEKNLSAIPNPLVFKKILSKDDIKNKKKKVLVVASSNHVKRIWLILRIWKEIEKDNNFNDWSFDFIGEGEDYPRLLNLAQKLKLKRIKFHGYKNPEQFYQEASIFLMTSKYEGWPMVLMECMQKGVVPIVYNSFESLTDIITDGYNGYIIPNNKPLIFIQKLKSLMQNQNMRQKMSYNCTEICSRYSLENIINQFESLFKDILYEKRN